jgi:hypothetical protein
MADRPQFGDKVYDERQKQPNGIIDGFNREYGEILVKFYADGDIPEANELIDKERFFGTWTEAYGGVWYLSNE